MRRGLWAAVFGLALGACAAAVDFELYIAREPGRADEQRNYLGALHEPPTGCYLGAFLDLDDSLKGTFTDQNTRVRRLPQDFERLTEREHASYFFYMGYGTEPPMDWLQYLARKGKMIHVALEPNDGLDKVQDDQYLHRIAKAFASIDAPIFVRFASEMNGPWVNYHGNANQYREKFRLVSETMHAHADNVAMVWCPYTTPVNPINDYYPGDEAVDWVGVNFYSVTYHNQRYEEPAHHINPTAKLDWVYDKYSDRKPIMIGEYGATHYSALEAKTVANYAKGCIASLYDALPRRYPRVKAIFYFNGNNLRLQHRLNNNYAVTQNPDVLAAYSSAISDPWFLTSYAKPQEEPLEIHRPIEREEVVYGEVDFSAWAPVHKDGYTVRFTIDGKTLYEADDRCAWKVSLFTARLENGPATIGAELLKNGRRVKRVTQRIVVDN